MRENTAAAVFAAVRQIGKSSAAALSQNVKRAIAKQAVEVVRVICGVTGEVFARPVAEIGERFSLPEFFAHTVSPQSKNVSPERGTQRRTQSISAS